MAKKRDQQIINERESRKEILRKRRQDQQLRQIRLVVISVVALIVVVIAIGLVNELVIAPNRAVATVSVTDPDLNFTSQEQITLRDWQDRVVYERAQRIIFLEDQLEAFGGNVGIIQQFAGQTILELQDEEGIGQSVLDLMVQESVVRQAARARGIVVTDEDVDRAIGESFGYYGGGLPTPQPTATQTAVPTPSLTPIPTPVITDVVPTAVPSPTPTAGPTSTPLPTSTPVSEESFRAQLSEQLANLRSYGVKESTFREYVRTQLYAERLADVLAEEKELATEAEHASIYVLSFTSQADADEARALMEAEGYLTVWNTVRSTAATETPAFPGASATELLWRTQDDLSALYTEGLAAAAFTLPLNQPSDVLVQPNQAEGQPDQYFIIQVSGREVRPLSESTIRQAKAQLVSNYINAQVAQGAQLTQLWRNRVPSRPMLDPLFLAPPTPTPVTPPTLAPIP